MSRIAKKPIAIPPKTEATFSGGVLTVKGPLGSISKTLRPYVNVVIENGTIVLTLNSNTLQARALWGTYASHIKNMIEGVNSGFTKKLIVEGIGYKADVTPSDITFKVGFSHPVKVAIPKELKVTSDKGVLVITGINKELVSSFASGLRAIKKPEPYKGKGIRYEDEVIRRKEGKKTA